MDTAPSSILRGIWALCWRSFVYFPLMLVRFAALLAIFIALCYGPMQALLYL